MTETEQALEHPVLEDLAQDEVRATRSDRAPRRVEFTFSCGTTLTYILNRTATAAKWAGMMMRMRPSQLLRMGLNHRHGFAQEPEIRATASRIKRCARVLGFRLDPLTRDSWRGVLNNLHARFPEFFEHDFDPSKFQAAQEMNLAMHWLEYELGNWLEGRRQYLFNLDFNHDPRAYNLKQPIPEAELGEFSTDMAFGSLHLHYIYVGRHFLEMFEANDTVCPSHQFRPQHEFNATCGLVFSEPTETRHQREERMRRYFESMGAESFFGYGFDDKALAKGFFQLGRLEDFERFGGIGPRSRLRAQLRKSSVVGWRFLAT
jgi:hypothetical protein